LCNVRQPPSPSTLTPIANLTIVPACSINVGFNVSSCVLKIGGEAVSLLPGEQMPVPKLQNALSMRQLVQFEHALIRAVVLLARNTLEDTRMNLFQDNVTHLMTLPGEREEDQE
jgi:hypothetical protein